MRQHRDPKQLEASLGVDVQDGVAVGEARSVGHLKNRPPVLSPFFQSGTLHEHIIGGALAGAMKPAGQQIAVGALHDAAGVRVFRAGRKNVGGGEERRGVDQWEDTP